MTLELALADTNDWFITTSPEKSTLSPSTKKPVSPFVCVGPTSMNLDAHAAQIERVIAVEGDVSRASLRVLQQPPWTGERLAKLPIVVIPDSANSAS